MSAEVEQWMREGERRERRWGRLALIAGIAAVIAASAVGWYVLANRVEAGDERVLDTLRGAGLRDPELGGAATFNCAEGESSRHFTATNADGARVEGTVCCGLTGVGKGCTVRW